MSTYIGKTPRIIHVRVRNKKVHLAFFAGGVSVKKRGSKWTEAEHVGIHLVGSGENEQEAFDDMFDKWEEFCQDKFNESVFVEQVHHVEHLQH
jgi:hypothetical protein